MRALNPTPKPEPQSARKRVLVRRAIAQPDPKHEMPDPQYGVSAQGPLPDRMLRPAEAEAVSGLCWRTIERKAARGELAIYELSPRARGVLFSQLMGSLKSATLKDDYPRPRNDAGRFAKKVPALERPPS